MCVVCGGEGPGSDRQADTQAVPDASAVIDNGSPIACGPVTALVANGTIRRIAFKGIEIVRSVDCPIRDANWGTAVPENVREQLDERADGVFYRRRFDVFEGALDVHLNTQFTPHGLRLDLSLTANRSVLTNRAGFTLLHPLDGVAGTALTIVHSDGSEEQAAFPMAVMAGQPAFDIAGLRHTVHGVAVDIAFAGDVFEMEDQRNWTDASFKTYCRPLSLPFPYRIEAGHTVAQSIAIKVSGDASHSPLMAATNDAPATLPDIALAATPAWLSGAGRALFDHVPRATRLVRVDLGHHDPVDTDRGIAKLGGPVEMELIVNDDGDIETPLADLAGRMRGSGIEVASVIALPRAYLKSYQPSGPWPAGRTITQAMNLAASEFPGARIGVGMLTNFTEFNRHAPSPELGDFVTYSTCAIVHAADDRSVFETLEALPHIHQSAKAIAGERPLRLGLASIGMRSNPYGAAVADNPGLDRIAMAMDDPRQRTLFGAAFAVGAYAMAAACGVARIALAGIGGPFATGVIENGRFTAWPIHHVIEALVAMAGGQRVANPALPASVFGIQADVDGRRMGVFANCGFEDTAMSMGGGSAIMMSAGEDVTDPDWLARAGPVASDGMGLAPGSVVFTRRSAA